MSICPRLPWPSCLPSFTRLLTVQSAPPVWILLLTMVHYYLLRTPYCINSYRPRVARHLAQGYLAFPTLTRLTLAM